MLFGIIQDLVHNNTLEEEEHARIRRNNDYNENNSYNEEEYNPYGLEVNTSFTLGLSLSNGGKRLLR